MISFGVLLFVLAECRLSDSNSYIFLLQVQVRDNF